MRNKKITVKIDIQKVIIITGDDGGYESGYCFLCNASGWLEGEYGHPYGAKDTGADLVHEKNCPINKELRK